MTNVTRAHRTSPRAGLHGGRRKAHNRSAIPGPAIRPALHGEVSWWQATWSHWQGEESFAQLWPDDADTDEYTDEYYVPPDHVRYKDRYSEAEARSQYPHLFASLGDPNVVDLDE